MVSELYADLHSLDPSIVGIDLVFFIINKVLDFLNVYVVMIILARSSFTIWRMSVPLLRYLPQWLLCFMLIPPMLPIGVVSVSIAYLPLYFFPPTSVFPSACFLLLVLTLITLFTRPCCPKASQDRTRFRTSSGLSSAITNDRPSCASHVSTQADETMSAFSI